MIKSKTSRTTLRGRQHAVLSTVGDFDQGRKEKKKMPLREGGERWEGLAVECLLYRNRLRGIAQR
jgi:hypothetical protein